MIITFVSIRLAVPMLDFVKEAFLLENKYQFEGRMA